MKNKINLFGKTLIAALIMLAIQSCGLVNSEAETTLIITVRDYNTQALIQGGSVTLYKDLSDWTNSQNGYRTTNTDINGQATFTGIDAGIDYYFEAIQGGKDNFNFTYHVGSPVKARQTNYASTNIQ